LQLAHIKDPLLQSQPLEELLLEEDDDELEEELEEEEVEVHIN